jgi:hypothetical protein
MSVRACRALSAGVMLAWAGGCSIFQSHQAPTPPPQTQAVPPQATPATRLPTRPERVRSKPAIVRKPLQHHPPPPSPPPVISLENSADTKANAQRLLDQVTVKLTHVNRAELAESTASAYQQVNELINEAQRAMADQDYLAASSLAEKASALTNELPSHGEEPRPTHKQE